MHPSRRTGNWHPDALNQADIERTCRLHPLTLDDWMRFRIPMRNPRRLWTVAALLFYSVMLVWSAIPGQQDALFSGVHDKLVHFGAYGCIALALNLGESGGSAQRTVRTIGLVAVLAGLDETIQQFEAHRTPEIADWAADLMAAIVVTSVAELFRSRGTDLL